MSESDIGDLDLSFMAELEASIGRVPEPEPVAVESPSPNNHDTTTLEHIPSNVVIAGEGQTDYAGLVATVQSLVGAVGVLTETVSSLFELQMTAARAFATALGATPIVTTIEEQVVPTEETAEAPRRRRARDKG